MRCLRPHWHLGMSGVPHGSELDLILFNILICCLENGIESVLTKIVVGQIGTLE